MKTRELYNIADYSGIRAIGYAAQIIPMVAGALCANAVGHHVAREMPLDTPYTVCALAAPVVVTGIEAIANGLGVGRQSVVDISGTRKKTSTEAAVKGAISGAVGSSALLSLCFTIGYISSALPKL